MIGARGPIHLVERGGEGRIEVPREEVGEHVVLVDRLALLVREVRRLEPGTRVQLDLAVLEARVHVEEDHQPVVEPGPADAPLVHQRARLGLGLLGRRILAAVLGVDHDLGAGPRLDRVDRRLGLDDRVAGQDPGVVVDRPVDLGFRERRAGRWADVRRCPAAPGP